MIVIVFSLLVCLLGLAMYAFARPEQAKVAETGRLMFFAGLLAFLLTYGPVFATYFNTYPVRR